MVKTSRSAAHVREKAQLLSASEIERTLVRLAHEIVEKNNGVANLGLIGILRRGVPLAQRLARILARIEKAEVPVGTVDITMYRDDLSAVGPLPEVKKSKLEFDIEDKEFSGAVEIAEVNGPDIKSGNTFGKTTVETARRTATASGRRFIYRFPAHSYTMLKVKLV